jgi:hypothetical protein
VKYTFTNQKMKIREIFETVSTTAGAIAVVAQPMGMISRSGDSMFGGKYTTAQTPNTPKEYKRKKRAR